MIKNLFFLILGAFSGLWFLWPQIITTKGWECTKDVIASGGVGSTNDLRNLSELSANGRTLRGVIVGRAFYEDKFSLSEAIEAFETV